MCEEQRKKIATLIVEAVWRRANKQVEQQAKAIESIVRDCGSKGRTMKSALIFAAPDPAENLIDKATEVLAWEDVDDDAETKKRIDESQLRLLARGLKDAKSQLDEAVFRAYRHLYLLDKHNNLMHIDLGNITSSSAGCLVEAYLTRLGTDEGKDIVSSAVPARKIPTYWPSSKVEWSTKAVRDAFYSSPLLPRLINPDAIKRAIADGISGGIIDYAVRDANGNLKLRKPNETLLDTQIEISDDVFILKEEDAQKLREPPALAELRLNRTHVALRSGDLATFKCEGFDQYGQVITTGKINWAATGGTIDSEGLYTAGDSSGQFEVTAKSGAIEAVASVVVQKDGPTPETPPQLPGKRTVRWSGRVPPQKWMNFYTKILSKMAANQDLILKISFEVPSEREQADQVADDAKTGLMELGLDDNVTVN